MTYFLIGLGVGIAVLLLICLSLAHELFAEVLLILTTCAVFCTIFVGLVYIGVRLAT